MEEKIFTNGFEFTIISGIGWISKEDNPWHIVMKTPSFNWKTPTIKSTEKENLSVTKSMLKIALAEINLKLKRLKGNL